jgi:hypothetical protein
MVHDVLDGVPLKGTLINHGLVEENCGLGFRV